MDKEKYIDALKLKMPYLDEKTIREIVDANLANALHEMERQERSEQIYNAVTLIVEMSSGSIDDADVDRIALLFPNWQVGCNYEQGDILRYNGEPYRVSQKVTGAQADHTPDKAVSLYKKIGEPTGGLFPWSQPQGAHDAYKKGDKVSHNGKTWVSTVDANVWEPGVYGWEEAKE